MEVREARPGEHDAALNVLDAAMLQTDGAWSTLLVAVEEDRVLGALALEGEYVVAVAVRRRRRGQGIGTALVEAAADRSGRLVAHFDPGVRPFYAALGFRIEENGPRLRGVREEGFFRS